MGSPLFASTLAFQLFNGVVWQCPKDIAFNNQDCTPISETGFTEILASNNHLLGIQKQQERKQLVTYRPPEEGNQDAQAWTTRSFDYVVSCDSNGFCDFHYRDSLSLKEDHGHLIVPQSDGSHVRADLSYDDLLFEPHNPPVATADPEYGMHLIGATNNTPGNYLMVNQLPAELGYSLIENRWEKSHAIQWLTEILPKLEDEKEIQRVQEAIAQLELYQEDDTMVFVPTWQPSYGQLAHDTLVAPLVGRSTEELPPLFEVKSDTEITHGFSTGPGNNYNELVKITPKQWAYITSSLTDPSITSAQQEREALAETVRRWELVVGAQTGGVHDVGGWLGNILTLPPAMVPGLGFYAGQGNCNIENFNVHQILVRLSRHSLLKFHSVRDATHGSLVTTWGMHQANAIIETETDKKFVIDAWPMGAGHLPHILPLEDWGLTSAWSLQILPTPQAWSMASPWSRFATGFLGLLLLYGWKGRGIRRMGDTILDFESRNSKAQLLEEEEEIKSAIEFGRQHPYHSGLFFLGGDDAIVPYHLFPSPAVAHSGILLTDGTYKIERDYPGAIYEHKEIPITDDKKKISTVKVSYADRAKEHPYLWGLAQVMQRPFGAGLGATGVFLGAHLASIPFSFGASIESTTQPIWQSEEALLIAGFLAWDWANHFLRGDSPNKTTLAALPLMAPAFYLGVGLAQQVGTVVPSMGSHAMIVSAGLGMMLLLRKALGKENWDGAVQRSTDMMVALTGRSTTS